MNTTVEQVITRYNKAYQQLFNRTPQYVYIIDDNWVLVDGSKMRVPDLETVTAQLNEAYQKEQLKRQSVVHRLISWLIN